MSGHVRRRGKRDYGDGGIEQRGPDTWRLRYRLNGRRFGKTVRGTAQEARKELRRLLKSGEDGAHVAPDKLTFSQWMDRWLELKAANRRHRTVERYRDMLRIHVVPRLGARPIQRIETEDINALYDNLDKELSFRSRHHVHVVLKACLRGAVKNKKITANPAADAEVPAPADDEGEVGQVLDANQMAELVKGFRVATIYDIVCVAAFTGMRRGEILGLRWTDLDIVNKALKIDRAIEYTRKHGIVFKAPKTKRGRRTITIDDSSSCCARRGRSTCGSSPASRTQPPLICRRSSCPKTP